MNIYKYWLIDQLDLIQDITNQIKKSKIIYEQQFKLPEASDFITNTYTNNLGIVFIKAPRNKPYHLNSEKTILLTFNNNNEIIHVDFLYNIDDCHYYSINYILSRNKLTIVNQDYIKKKRNNFCMIFIRNTRDFIFNRDPTFTVI